MALRVPRAPAMEEHAEANEGSAGPAGRDCQAA